MRSYSQFGEDVELQKRFAPGYCGIAINVGATDGVAMDNTLHFEQSGWRVINIEANPNFYPSLCRNREIVVKCAAGRSNETTEFTVVTLDGWNQTAISGLKIDQQLLADHSYLNPQLTKVTVPVRTLDDIISDFPWVDRIDFVSIDTEGTELDVLHGFDIARWKPRYFIIENNWDDPAIGSYLAEFGYQRFARIEVNDLYELVPSP